MKKEDERLEDQNFTRTDHQNIFKILIEVSD